MGAFTTKRLVFNFANPRDPLVGLDLHHNVSWAESHPSGSKSGTRRTSHVTSLMYRHFLFARERTYLTSWRPPVKATGPATCREPIIILNFSFC